MKRQNRDKPQVINTDLRQVESIIHISDVHIRKRERHAEYQIVFNRLYEEIKKYPNTLVAITGDTVHDKTDLVPESIDMFRRFMIDLTNITEVIILVGNHDVNIFNVGSLDSLTPLITNLQTRNKIHLLNENSAYRFGQTNLVFGVTTIWANSVTDIDSWDLSHIDNPIKIALYHGMIHGCTLDNGLKALNNSRCTNSSYFNVSDFTSYDITLLGDVHKHQFLNSDRTVAYAGSLIQQKRDEDLIEHGYILWKLSDSEDIRDLSAEFFRIPSDYGIIEIEVPDSIDEYVKKIKNGNKNRPRKSGRLIPQYKNEEIPPNLDIKLRYSTIEGRGNFKKIYRLITNLLKRNIVRTSEFMVSKTEGFEAQALRDIIEFGSVQKTGDNDRKRVTKEVKHSNNVMKDRSDIEDNRSDSVIFKIGGNDVVIRAIMNFYDKKTDKSEHGTGTRELIRREVSSILKKIDYNYESDVKNIKFKSIEFENMFIYLDKNEIDFSLFDRIVGLNAGNFQGKSSFIDVVLYAIYGKCSRGKRFDILNIKKNQMMSRIVLEVNGVEYVITRNSYINSRKNRDLKESVVFCEGGRDITADDRVKTHKLIESKICSYSDMVNNSFILQKNGSSFTELSDREKKDILCKMARLDVFDMVFHEAKSRHFSHSQTFGKTVRRLDPLMNKYLSIEEIKSVLPKSKSKKAASESNQRKLDLIHEKMVDRSGELKESEEKLIKRIAKFNRILTNLEKEISSLETTEQFGDQLQHTIQSYNRNRQETHEMSMEIIGVLDQIRQNESEFREILQGSTIEKMETELKIRDEEDRKRLNALQDSLLKFHTRLQKVNHTEDEIRKFLSSKQESLIDSQDKLIGLNDRITAINDEISQIEEYSDLDNLVINAVRQTEAIDSEIRSLRVRVSEYETSLENINTSLLGLKDHDYDPECEKCMSNPVTKSILHYRSEMKKIQQSISNLQDTINDKRKQLSDLKIVEYQDRTIHCDEWYAKALSHPQELIDKREGLRKVDADITTVRNGIERLKSEIDRNQKELEKIKENRRVEMDIERTRQDINSIQNQNKTEDVRIKLSKVFELQNRRKEMDRRLGEKKEQINRIYAEMERFELMDLADMTIRSIERSDLKNRIDALRTRSNKLRNRLKELSANLTDTRTEANGIELDLGRFEEIRESIQDESNSKLVLEQIKALLDRSGLVDDLLTRQIIPYIQNRINNILSDVGHYRVNITYRNQSVNIYKDDGLNIAMSSGYESYLLDLVFRLALVQINNHIRTDFLVIDEGFNACDAEHKENIRDLLEYMKTYYSWLLVVSHDDYIKSFYDQSIQIQTVKRVDENDPDLLISGSLIRNVDYGSRNVNQIQIVPKSTKATNVTKTARSKATKARVRKSN